MAENEGFLGALLETVSAVEQALEAPPAGPARSSWQTADGQAVDPPSATVRRAALVDGSGRALKLGGYHPDPPQPDVKQYQATRYGADELPPAVDLRPHLTPVEDQGHLSSCVANAMAGAYEYLIKRSQGDSPRMSRLFVYYGARELDHETNKDAGTTLSNAIKSLRKRGACKEDTWPYDKDKVFTQPSSPAYQEAVSYVIQEAQRVNLQPLDVKHCLAEGYPVGFGIDVFGSFQEVKNDGRIPMPNADSEEHLGGHAMLCVGYSETDQAFIIRNSWGTDWGDNGYGYMPYDYFLNQEYNGDCWTIRGLTSAATGGQVLPTDADLSDGTWIQTAESIITVVAEVAQVVNAFEVAWRHEKVGVYPTMNTSYSQATAQRSGYGDILQQALGALASFSSSASTNADSGDQGQWNTPGSDSSADATSAADSTASDSCSAADGCNASDNS